MNSWTELIWLKIHQRFDKSLLPLLISNSLFTPTQFSIQSRQTNNIHFQLVLSLLRPWDKLDDVRSARKQDAPLCFGLVLFMHSLWGYPLKHTECHWCRGWWGCLELYYALYVLMLAMFFGPREPCPSSLEKGNWFCLQRKVQEIWKILLGYRFDTILRWT